MLGGDFVIFRLASSAQLTKSAMFEDQKVRQSISFALLILSFFLVTKIVSEIKTMRFIGSSLSQQSHISVQGKGEVVGIPDLATFSFSVTEESLVVKDAQDVAAKQMNAVLSYLKTNGIEEKDITTAGYRIYPRYDYGVTSSLYPRPQGKQTLAAYVVSQSVTVKIRNLEDAGKLLGGIGELGATNISGLTFDFDDRDSLVKEARDKAIVEARAEAKKLSKSLGVRLVRIVSYSEGGNYPRFYAQATAEAVFDGGGSVVPDIPVGEDKITSNVTITYEIK